MNFYIFATVKLIKDKVEEEIGCTVVGMAVMPLAVGEGLTALAIYYRKGSVGVSGAIIGAGLIKIIPELMEVGLISSATGVGAVIFTGVALAA